MNQAKEARHFLLDTFVVGLTLGVAKLRALITMPLVVKLLGTENYGIWSQTLTLSTVLGGVFLLNIHLPLVRFVSADRSKAGPVYASVLAVNVLIFLVLAVPALALTGPISEIAMGKPGLDRFVVLALALILVGNVRLINLNFYRATDRIKLRSYIDMASTVLSMALIVAMLIGHRSVFTVLLTLVVWEGSVAAITTVHCFKVAGINRPDREVIRQAFHYCMPLLPAGLSVVLLDRSDRFFISNHLGLVNVGIYSAGYALATGLLMFQSPLQFTLLPKVSSLWDRDRGTASRYLSLAIHAFLALAIPCVCALPVLGPAVLRMLGNADTGSASPVMLFLIACGVLFWGVALCLTNIFYAANRTASLARILLVTALVNVGLNAVLVPTMALSGAALGTAISYALTLSLLYIQGRTDLSLTWYPGFLVKSSASAVVMTVVLALWSPQIKSAVAAALATGVLIYFLLLVVTRALRKEHWDRAIATFRP